MTPVPRARRSSGVAAPLWFWIVLVAVGVAVVLALVIGALLRPPVLEVEVAPPCAVITHLPTAPDLVAG